MSSKSVYLATKDYSITGEDFELVVVEKYSALKTVPQPNNIEIKRYYESEDYISHTDNKRNLFEKAYRFVKLYSIKKKCSLVSKFQKNPGTILDFGCGTGDFLAYMQKNNWTSYGYEPNEKARESAKSKGLSLLLTIDDVEDGFFDVISLWHVFEHLDNPEVYISKFQRILKPEGMLIIAVPNYLSYDAQYYDKYWAAYDVPRHLWHFSDKSIEILADTQKMKVIKVLPMWFDSFYVSMLSEKYKTGRINLFKSIWIGLISNFYGIKNHQFSSHIYIINNK